MGKRATRAASLLGFLLFFVTCHAARDVAQCHAICIFFYPGDSHMKGAGMLVGNFEKPLKETNLGVGQPFLTPERGHFATRHHFFTMFFC